MERAVQGIKGSLTSFSFSFWTREIKEYSIISLVQKQKEKDVNEPLSASIELPAISYLQDLEFLKVFFKVVLTHE